jgi:hypothetical protein
MGRIYTLDDLKRDNDAKEILQHRKITKPSFLNDNAWSMKEYIGFFVGSHFELEEPASPTVTEANIKKLRGKFDKMKKSLDDECTNIEKQMVGMSERQQNEIISYWDIVSNFLMDTFKFFQKMFTDLIEKLRQGYEIAKSALSELMREIAHSIKEIFQ